MVVISSAFVVAGCVTGVIAIVLAVRHHEGEEVSKWIGAALALLAVGAALTSFS